MQPELLLRAVNTTFWSRKPQASCHVPAEKTACVWAERGLAGSRTPHGVAWHCLLQAGQPNVPLRNFLPPLRASCLGSRVGQVSAPFLRRKSKDSLCGIFKIPGNHPPTLLLPNPHPLKDRNSRDPAPYSAAENSWLGLRSQTFQTKPGSVWGWKAAGTRCWQMLLKPLPLGLAGQAEGRGGEGRGQEKRGKGRTKGRGN